MLEHPLTRGLSVDDPRTTEARRKIIQEKSFLRQIYVEWYRAIVAKVPPEEGPILEIGSGAGFQSKFLPGVITSEILPCSGVKVVLDAHTLPFGDGSLRAIVMTDVLHHLPQVRSFFAEAARCVRVGGSIVMIEPWVTPWSRVIYQHFHPEPILPDALSWEFPSSGPLSGANSALPWILFSRDRLQFEAEFPEWTIRCLRPVMPFRYLLSGGLSRIAFMPGWSFPLWRRLELALQPWMNHLAMFAHIVLERTGPTPSR